MTTGRYTRVTVRTRRTSSVLENREMADPRRRKRRPLRRLRRRGPKSAKPLELIRAEVESRPLLQRRPEEITRARIDAEQRLQVQPRVAQRGVTAEFIRAELVQVVSVADRAAVAGAGEARVDVQGGDVERAVAVQVDALLLRPGVQPAAQARVHAAAPADGEGAAPREVDVALEAQL